MLLAFDLFTGLFQRIDQSTATFVTDISSKVIIAITPVVTVGVTLVFIAYGLLIIRGAVETPVTEFIARSFRIAIILSIALAGGLYQTDIAGLIGSVTDDLALALVANPGQSTDAASVIDAAAQNGFDRGAEAFDKGGFFVDNGTAYYALAIIIFVVTGFLAAVGGAFIIVAKVGLAVLAGLGPLFIVALLFQPTYRFFELWLGQVVNYGLLIVLFAIVFGLIISIYGDYVADITFDGTQNVWYAVGVASMVLVLQLPSIASSLAGGVALGVEPLESEAALPGGAAPLDRVTMDAYGVIQYVLVRESYDSSTARTAAEVVASLSGLDVWLDYGKRRGGPNGVAKALGERNRIEATISFIEFASGSEAVVRFETREIDKRTGRSSASRRWVATLAYTYVPVLLREEDRRINPWGFRVTRYRVDPDSVAAREDAP